MTKPCLRAVLDADLVLRGFEEVKALGETDVDGGAGDLAIGRYRWLPDQGCFVPLRQATPEEIIGEEHTLCAIALGLLDLALAGHRFPKITRRWLRYYVGTHDADLLRERLKRPDGSLDLLALQRALED